MYARLFGTILDSSINVSTVPLSHRWLWVVILIIGDEGGAGVVDMPVERLAARAGMTPEDVASGLEFLSSPDPESRSKDEEGRRIIRLDGSARAWLIVNWEKYRKIRKEEERRENTREAVRKHRAKKAEKRRVADVKNL